MDGEFIKDVVHLVLRWIHVVAGVTWIGHLYFFNWVNGHVAKTYDAETKKKVVPELMPRALYWFRWGAAYTWVSGVLLVGYVYYMNRALMGLEKPEDSLGLATIRAFSLVIIGPVLYFILWKRAFKGKEQMGVAVSFVLLAAITWYLSTFLPGRTVFIHVGGILGTTMFMNVWMVIWPNQRKIIAATKEGKAPDADLVAVAGLRSKQNTYMSVPLIFTMVSNHFPLVYGFAPGGVSVSWVLLLVLIVIGWLVTKSLYTKAGKPEPAKF